MAGPIAVPPPPPGGPLPTQKTSEVIGTFRATKVSLIYLPSQLVVLHFVGNLLGLSNSNSALQRLT